MYVCMYVCMFVCELLSKHTVFNFTLCVHEQLQVVPLYTTLHLTDIPKMMVCLGTALGCHLRKYNTIFTGSAMVYSYNELERATHRVWICVQGELEKMRSRFSQRLLYFCVLTLFYL